MQLKHPEILYFLLLLIVPILVHLFQLRRFKKEYFTNVQFLKELSIQTRKSSKLKKWLLLATRLLVLACLILAFCQPFFNAKDNKNATNEMYIILDNSFSMQAKGQKGALLKRAVEDLLAHTPNDQNFSLITNSETFWNTDIKTIQTDLQNLPYSGDAFELDHLMAKINAHKSAFAKDIVVISDAIGLQSKQLKSIEKAANTYFIVPKSEQKSNVAIDSVFVNQTLDQFYEIGVKLTAFGDSSKEMPISLFNDNKLIAKTLINFDGAQKTINFTIPKTDFNGYVSIVDNSLEYDNTYYFSISKNKKINVLSIGTVEKSIFLSRIYTQTEFNYNNFSIESLDYNQLEKQDAIVLNELSTIPDALQKTLLLFVEKGGNLILIPSSENAISNLNNFVRNFGDLQFKTIENKEKLITKISFEHPLLTTVFEKKIDNFQYPMTKKSFEITSTNPAILSYADQSTFLTSIQKDLSSIYIFNAPINKTNSNFENSPLIVPIFYNMAQTIQKTGVNAMNVGQNQVFLVDADLSKDDIISVNNATEKFIPTQQILNKKVKLTFNENPKTAGNFGVFNHNDLIRNISFNYKRTESNLTIDNENVLADYKKIDNIETVFDSFKTDRTNNELWKWFAVLTLLFLIAELLIQKYVK